MAIPILTKFRSWFTKIHGLSSSNHLKLLSSLITIIKNVWFALPFISSSYLQSQWLLNGFVAVWFSKRLRFGCSLVSLLFRAQWCYNRQIGIEMMYVFHWEAVLHLFLGVPLFILIFQLEHEGIEVHEQLYRAVLKSLKQDRQFRYRIFFDTPLTRYIALQERTEQLVQGTTGLSCWQVFL